MVSSKMREKVWEALGGNSWKPDDEWIPLYFSKPGLPITRGENFVKLAPATFELNDGFREGERFDLTPWQQFSLRSMFEEKLDGTLRYRRFLLGLPRKQGKSILCSSIVLSTLIMQPNKRKIYSASLTMKQAKIVFEEVVDQIGKSKSLSKYLKVTASENKITNLITGSTYEVIAADSAMAQGFKPYLVIFDEIHELHTEKGQAFWEALVKGSGSLKESLIICITTAGSRSEGLLPTLFSSLRELHNEPDDESSFGGIWWGASNDDDISDPEVWKKAMPNLRLGLYDLSHVKASYIEAEKTGRLNSFCRYELNQFIEAGSDGDQFMTESTFEMNYNPTSRILKGSKIWVGFDGSVSGDSTAFTAIDEKGNIEVLGLWEDDGSKSWFVNKDEVNEKLDFIMKNYNVQKLWCDDNQFQSEVQKWAVKYRGKVERIPQSKSRMEPLSNDFILSWVSNEMNHNNDRNIKKHFLNAWTTDDGRPIKKTKDSKDKIDILIACILAFGARQKMLPNLLNKSSRAEMLRRMNSL